MRSVIPFVLLLTIFDATYGIRIPFEVRTNAHTSHISRRSTTIGVKNIGNAQYIGNVTIGGAQARVLLDTGSSDLWANFPTTQPTSTDLGESIKLAYAVGAATGSVHAATVQIGDYSVDNQAFLLVGNTSSFSTDIHAQGYDGLLGLGPNKGSVIYKKLDGHTGDTLLTHIFEQNTSANAYITFLLDRKNGGSEPFTGQLTISEMVEGFENITKMPQLDVDRVNKLLSQDQHWQAITDPDVGIIGPDGNPIQIDSIVPSAPDGTYVAVFDSGFTFNQVPRAVSDAIYGRVQGAVYDTKNEYWTIPCGQYLNVSISFDGVRYPVHPLDTVDDNFHIINASGNRVCIGSFQPITSAFSLLGHYDMILGMSFLRNTYTLLDFGNWADGADGASPYIQLLSVTNPAQARQDFITMRFSNDTNAINDPKWNLLSASQMQHSPVSSEEKKKAYEEKILSRWPYILVGCLVGLLLIVGCCIWRFCCSAKAKARKAKKNKKTSQLFATQPESTAYLPLELPYRHSEGYSQSQLSLSNQPHLGASKHHS